MAAGSTYTPIATYTAPSAQASYTFNTGLSGYTDLVLIASINSSYTTDQGLAVNYYINGIGTGYSHTRMWGTGSTAASSRGSGNASGFAGRMVSSNGGNTSFSTLIMNFMNYSNSSTYKTVLSRTSSTLSTEATEAIVSMNSSTTAAITSITVFPEVGNFVTGSTFTLYGIAKA